jgi:anaerobic selenocysteine-containing dehydrogenase
VTATDRIVKLTCTHDCPDACAMLVTIRDGRAVDVAPNPAHPVTGRHLCAKVDRYLERVYSSDRVLHPLRRTGAKGSATFERVSWDAAIDEIGRRWEAILAAEGPAAILPYSYLGSMGTLVAFGTMHAVFHSSAPAASSERSAAVRTRRSPASPAPRGRIPRTCPAPRSSSCGAWIRSAPATTRGI